MPDAEQLQLKLELETEKAKREATEALGEIEEEVKGLAETFTDVSTKLENVADAFSVLKTRSASDLQNVSKTVKTTEEEFDKLTDTQQRGTEKMGVAGKVMGAVWKDLSSGMGALKGRVTELIGLRGLALGGVGITGGIVATLVGSFLTVDKIRTSIRNLTFDAQGLRGQFLGIAETEVGETFQALEHHVTELHAEFLGLGHKGAVEVMAGFARSGIEATSLNDSVRNLSVSMDTFLGLPAGTTLADWANKSKEFGAEINNVGNEMINLYGDFNAFIEQGRKGAVTVVDFMNSLEMASRSLSGWRTNWMEMIDLQLLYIEGAEKAGMSTEGAALSFGDLAGSLANLSSEKWGFILQNMEKISTVGMPEEVQTRVNRIQEILKKTTKEYGGDFYAMVEAARTMPVLLKEEGEKGDLGTWYGMITEAMQARGIEGYGVQMEFLQRQMGMSRGVSKAITEMGEFYKREKEGPLAKEDTEKRNALLERIGKEQAEDRLTASERITAGIARWWVRVAPSIFSMIIGSVDLIVKAIGVIAGETEWADVKESMAFTTGAFTKFIDVTKTEFKDVLENAGKTVEGIKDLLPPSWTREEEQVKISRERELIEKLRPPDEPGWKKIGMGKRESWMHQPGGEDMLGVAGASMGGIFSVIRGKELLIKITKGQILQVLAGEPDGTSKGGV